MVDCAAFTDDVVHPDGVCHCEIDIRHYNAIGKISDALSLHADEAYDELTDNGKRKRNHYNQIN